jgi:hypothetical protein
MSFNKRYITSDNIIDCYLTGGVISVYNLISKPDAIIITGEINFCKKVIDIINNQGTEGLESFFKQTEIQEYINCNAKFRLQVTDF